jgi:DNA-binding winged helix-turn-helix (wHTH) protein/tetratricopeptide (TPR) repeat protein
MVIERPARIIFEFDLFRLDVQERLLLRAGEAVPITPKVFDTLLLLVEERGRLVEKDELMNRLWPDSFVEEGALTRNISDLRKVLGEKTGAHKFIETVPKHGYRFIAEVRVSHAKADAALSDSSPPLFTAQPAQPSTSWTQRVSVRMLAASLVIALGAGMWWRSSRSRPPENVAQIKSLAVLPFRPLNPNTGHPYLELGVADTLIARLGSFEQLLVRPTSAIRKYTDASLNSLETGRELQVDAILEGSIQKLDDRVRVTVKLLRVADGRQLWAYQCEEYCTNLFTAQDAISENVATALSLQLTGAERQRLTKQYTNNTEAYQLYLRGRWLWNRRTAEDFQKAIGYFDQALALDPKYALALAGLADCWQLLSGYSFISPQEAMPKAKVAVEQALALDPTLAEAHTTSAMIAQNYERDWAKAEKSYQRAIEINPNYATALAWYGEMIAWLGRPEQGFALMQRAIKLDPTSLVFNKDAAVILYLARKNDQAVAHLKKTIELDPNFAEAHFWLAMAYTQQGQYAAAIAKYHEVWNRWQHLHALAGRGHVYALSGRQDEARQVLKQMQTLSRQKYVQPIRFAFIHTALGEKDQAFAWLEKEYHERGVGLTGLRTDPIWDSLRTDARFTDLLRRMHLN